MSSFLTVGSAMFRLGAARNDVMQRHSTARDSMLMSMTHSIEVSNVNQVPDPTDMSAWVMTPHKKKMIRLCALLNRQGRLLVLCSRQCTESLVKKRDHQAYAVTNSPEFKKVIWNKTAESSDSLKNKRRGFGEKYGRLLCPFGASSSTL